MLYGSGMENEVIRDVLALIDADIAAAEAVVADLKRKREGAEVFAEYLSGNEAIKARVMSSDTGTVVNLPFGNSPSAIVEAAIKANNLGDFTTEDINHLVREHELTRTQISNALTYLRRIGLVERGDKRGHWRRVSGALAHGTTDTNGPETGPFALTSIAASGSGGGGAAI
jgi:hypothetical protein